MSWLGRWRGGWETGKGRLRIALSLGTQKRRFSVWVLRCDVVDDGRLNSEGEGSFISVLMHTPSFGV